MADAATSPDAVAASPKQGVIKAFDPITDDGTIVCDTDLAEYEIARGALEDSIFRMLRQGQRVVFDVDHRGMAIRLRMGSEIDMGTPGFPVAHPGDAQHPQGGGRSTD